MRWGTLAVALLALAGAAQNTAFDDKGVRVTYSPQNLWRSEHGAFLGAREGGNLVLVFDFFDSEASGRYFACPPNRGDPKLAPTCEAVQSAVGQALAMWSRAAGKLILRRRESPSEPVNIWIAWTNAFPGAHQPIGRSVDNSRDAGAPERSDADQGFEGFDRVAYPGIKKTYGALLFNDKYCWFLDEAACPAPVRLDNGKVVSNNRSIRLVSLHEAGHVLGFGHFTVPSIM